MSLPMPGRFNVANALGALVAADALTGELDVLVAALERGVPVPGRFEPVDAGQHFAVLVDYAHTPDSLENVLAAARELVAEGGERGRVLCVFGAGGDRDRGKRPLMGAIAERLADVAIVTSDNPRSEDPQRIIEEIMAGVVSRGMRAGCARGRSASWARGTAHVRTVADRRAAIEQAIADRAARRRRRDRGQGPRAGAGVRRRPQAAVRRRSVARAALEHTRREPRSRLSVPDRRRRRAGGLAVRDWDARHLAAAAGASVARGRRRAGAPVAQPCARARPGRQHRLAHAAAGRAVRGAARRAGGRRRARRAGAAGGRLGRARAPASTRARPSRRLAPVGGRGGRGARARRSARGAAGARARVAARAARSGREGGRDHRLDRQDLDQGHPRGAARRHACASAASPANLNTEIGLPLALLARARRHGVLVLEMAMRGAGQIAELTAIAEPDVGVIVNVGPAHLELLGSLEAIAAAKAELIAGLAPGASFVVPADEPLLARHLRA